MAPYPISEVNGLEDVKKQLFQVLQGTEFILNEAELSGDLVNPTRLRGVVEYSILNKCTTDLQRYVALLCFFVKYLGKVKTQQVRDSPELLQYVLQLAAEYLQQVDLDVLYSEPALVKQFNIFLPQFAELSESLTAASLYESAVKVAGGPALTFLETFATAQLFKQQQFTEIAALYDAGVCDFSTIDSTSLNRLQIFRFYFEVSKTLYIRGRYQDAYATFNVLFGLPVVIPKADLPDALSFYTLDLILLGRDANARDPNIVNWGSAIPTNILNIFQSYHTFQLAQFLRLVCLEYVQRREIHGELEKLFTKEVVAALAARMVQKKDDPSAASTAVEALQMVGIDATNLNVAVEQTAVSVDDFHTSVTELALCNATLDQRIQKSKEIWSKKLAREKGASKA